MTDEVRSFQSWQFYTACRKILGMERLQRLFQRSRTEIFAWGANPLHCAETRANPLDRLSLLCRELDLLGHGRIARDALGVIAREIGCRLVPIDDPEPDQDDVRDECLDDLPALCAFHEAVRRGEELPEIDRLAGEAVQEIRETAALARRERIKA